MHKLQRCAVAVLGLWLGLVSVAGALSISGTVRDTLAVPVAGVLVVVTSEDDPTVRQTTVTDAEGRYRLAVATAILDVSRAIPGQFALYQNWPNPFNPSTQLGYRLDRDLEVELAIINVLGQQVRMLDQGLRPVGTYQTAWDGLDDAGRPLAAGVYLYRLRAGDRSLAGKMVMLDGAVALAGAGPSARAGSGVAPVGKLLAGPYTLEVAGPGIVGYRLEHAELADGQVCDITVARLPADQQHLGVSEVGASGELTVAAGGQPVLVRVLNEQGQPAPDLAGLQVTAEQVQGGSFVLLTDPQGALLPGLRFVPDDQATAQVVLPMATAGPVPGIWSVAAVPTGLELPVESLVDTLPLSQVAWYAAEHDQVRGLVLHHPARWERGAVDPDVVLYATNGGRLLHLDIPADAGAKLAIDPVTVYVVGTLVVVGVPMLLDVINNAFFAEEVFDNVMVPALAGVEPALDVECLGQTNGELRVPLGSVLSLRALHGGADVTERTTFSSSQDRIAVFDEDQPGRLIGKKAGSVVVDATYRLTRQATYARIPAPGAMTIHFVEGEPSRLGLTTLATDPAIPGTGESFALSLTLANSAPVAVAAPPRLHVVDVDEGVAFTPPEGLPIPPVNAGGTYSLSLAGVLRTAGLHELHAYFDGDDRIFVRQVRVRERNNRPPTAVLACTDAASGVPVTEGYNLLPVVFSAAGSVDPEGGELTYEWDTDADGVTDFWGARKAMVLHNGSTGDQALNFSLRVTDQAMWTSEATLHLTIHPNQVPVAAFTISPDDAAARVAGTPLTFDASASSDRETPAARLRFQWDFDGDGAWDTDLSSANRVVNHTFAAAGPKSVRLLVEDEQGNPGQKAMPFPVYEGVVSVTGFSADPWPEPDRRALAKVTAVNGIPRLSINGVQVPLVMFFGNTDMNARYPVIEEEFRKAGRNGVHLHSLISSPALSSTRPDAEKYFDLESDLTTAITGDPDGFILLRVNTGRYGNVSGYPESELVKFATTRVTANPMVSIASDLWLADAQKMLADMVAFIRNDPVYSKHVIGYHLECGEWFQYMFRENGLDISEANTRKLREWLTAKYGDDASLRTAWSDSGVSLSSAVVPADLPGNLSFVSESRTLLLGSSDRRFTDYLDFISDLVSSRIAALAATIKEACDGESIVIAFYGYLFELADPQSGHFSLRRLLADPHLDGFAGPLTYLDRNRSELYPQKAPGSTGAAMSVVDAIQRAGKIWFNESDNRTFINRTGSTAEHDTYLVPIETVPEIVEVCKRDVGQAMIRGGAVWFMDLWSVGWYDDEAIWRSNGKLASLYAAYAKTQRTPKYDVAFLVDEKAMSLVAQPTDSAWHFLSYQRYDFYRAGFSFGTFTLEDLADGRIPDAKALFVLDPFRIDAAMAEKLKKAAEVGRRTLVFVYGFGSTAPADIAKLTGMEIRSTSARASVRMAPTASAAGFGLGGKSFFGADVLATPRWYVESGADTVLARFTDNGKDAFAVKDNGTFRSVFFGGMRMDTDTIRAIVRYAGGHVFLETDDVTMASDDLVVVHASRAGAKTVRFPAMTDVYDYFEGRWSLGVTSVTVAMQPGETRYFFYGAKSAIVAKGLPAW